MAIWALSSRSTAEISSPFISALSVSVISAFSPLILSMRSLTLFQRAEISSSLVDDGYHRYTVSEENETVYISSYSGFSSKRRDTKALASSSEIFVFISPLSLEKVDLNRVLPPLYTKESFLLSLASTFSSSMFSSLVVSLSTIGSSLTVRVGISLSKVLLS